MWRLTKFAFMKKVTLIAAFLLCCLAQAQDPAKEAYIKKYAPIAVQEMKRTGVPASITLAQGLLESAAGQSRLATKANNHFGIKCHKNWKGKTIRHDDDARNECFRAYDKAEDSFRDHSDFLRYGERYRFLFDLKPTDYKGWCYGLKQAGYATDPKYATKLIGIVESYKLYKSDNVKVEVLHPDKLEQPEIVTLKASDIKYNEEFAFETQRPVYSINGVNFVYAREGDSYSSIAKMYNLFLSEILRFNESTEDIPLMAGEIVYIEQKKNRTQKGLDMYIVAEDGEDLRSICQRFGVKSSAVRRRNKLGKNEMLVKDEELRLR